MTTSHLHRFLAPALIVLALAWAAPARAADPAAVQPNDNRRAAGRLAQGTLTLSLRAARGVWAPEGADGPTVTIDAFGEADAPLQVPGPLIRVPEGTTILASVRNELLAPLTVHGLCARDGAACPTLSVPPGETREVRFASGRPGTYHYWASSFGAPVPFRELSGALVVDPVGAAPADRVLVITEWSSLAPAELRDVMMADDPGETFVAKQPGVAFMVNGLAWPATERLAARVGEPVRWRVVNLSGQPHPMHLHGFYFDVDSVGDGLRDVAAAPEARRRVVTHVLPPAGTLLMTWLPERDGNWLFHCHLMEHVSPLRRLPRAGDTERPAPAGGHHATHDPSLGMSGLVLGVTVRGAAAGAPRRAPALARAEPAADPAASAPRRLTLTMRTDPTADEAAPTAGFVLREGDAPPSEDRVTSPGPALVLRRGEPVEITLVNGLAEATAIHWHGMELDSYYDGVHGFSGSGLRHTPIIEPGGWFVVRFTPPRAGTFMYHTHLHDHRQLSSGLYGALLVVAPDEPFTPATDHAFVLGRAGLTSGRLALPDASTPVVLNGERAPRHVWAAGTRHRVRLMNITADDILEVTLRRAAAAGEWTPVAKDGAALPAALQVPVPARQVIAVGETYDFDVIMPPGRGTWWLEVRTAAGKWQLQSQIVVR